MQQTESRSPLRQKFKHIKNNLVETYSQVHWEVYNSSRRLKGIFNEFICFCDDSWVFLRTKQVHESTLNKEHLMYINIE